MCKSKILVKIGGSLFREDATIIKNVTSGLCLLAEDHHITLIVGSGPIGEYYKTLREKIGIYGDYAVCSNNADDLEIWRMIQIINMQMLIYLNPNLKHNLDVVVPSEEQLSARWHLYKTKIRADDIVRFEQINRQKSDIKALTYGEMHNIHKYVILTDVDGVYSENPNQINNAIKYNSLTQKDLWNIEFGAKNPNDTCLDIGISLLLKYFLASDTEIIVTSHKKFSQITTKTNNDIIESLKKCGTWISNTIDMQ